MNGTGAFTKGLAEVLSFWERAEYDRALGRLEQMQKGWPGNAQLHVLWAKLVQLQDEPAHTLTDVKRALQQAAELDKQSPAAAIELGHFLDNVEDDPHAAAKAFVQGITAARLALIDGSLGLAKSLLQLDKREDAVRSLIEAMHLADAERSAKKGQFASRIDELLKELGQTQSV